MDRLGTMSKAELIEALRCVETTAEYEAVDDALMDRMTIRELEVGSDNHWNRKSG